MFAQERLNLIKKIVRKHRRMNFVELQERIKVSPATLRRDLTDLEKSRDIIRVHGGILDPGYVRSEISLDERVTRNTSAKKAIAAAAARLVPSGSTIFVDAGSTCLEAGKLLLGRNDIRLITHSATLLEAAFRGQAAIVCLGGELRKVSGALTGGSALGALVAIHADIAFVGASGLDSKSGCSTTELSEAEIKKAVLARTSRKILLADHSKWENPSTIQFGPWSDFNDWITDKTPSPAETASLRAKGLKIHRPAP